MTHLFMWVRAHWPHPPKPVPLPKDFNPEMGWTTDTDCSEGDNW